jgi:hypothetical protein
MVEIVWLVRLVQVRSKGSRHIDLSTRELSMKYLCLCYYDTAVFASLSPSELEAIGPSCRPHDAALKATGKMIVQGSLAMPEAWTTIVPRGGRPDVRPGQYTTDSAQAGAFFIVDAATSEEAIAVAAKHAAANVGDQLGFAIEVRPCEMYETY